MAYSIQRVTSDGTLDTIAVSFEFDSRDTIKVYVDGFIVTTGWSWAGPTTDTIIFDDPIPDGIEVIVRRVSDLTRVAHIFGYRGDGSGNAAFDADSIDDNFEQTMWAAQEVQDGNELTQTSAETARAQALVAEQMAGEAALSATEAEASAIEAAASAASIGGDRDAAEAAAAAALVSQNAAAASATEASGYLDSVEADATAAVNAAATASAAAIATGEDAAATEADRLAAEASATAAAGSEANAADSATAAGLSEGAAADSAAAALASEIAAAGSAATVDSESLSTDYAGPTEPVVKWAYMTWADTTNQLLKRRNATNDAWVIIGDLFQYKANRNGDAAQAFKAAPSTAGNEVVVQSQAYGVGQSRVPFLATDRPSGVLQTNLTGKAIEVRIAAVSSAPSQYVGIRKADGVSWFDIAYADGSGFAVTASAIILPNEQYACVWATSGLTYIEEIR